MPMKRHVLSRYERTAAGQVLIDVAATRVEDLYNDFDKNAPYVRRDLDPDLVDYLIGCAREVARKPFVIRFTLDRAPDESRLARIRRSVNAYFIYLAEVERQNVLRMFRRSAILFGLGLAIMSVSVAMRQMPAAEHPMALDVFGEGLTIAAWVAMWESLAIFLIEWLPHHRDRKLYLRIAAAPLRVRPEPVCA